MAESSGLGLGCRSKLVGFGWIWGVLGLELTRAWNMREESTMHPGCWPNQLCEC